MKRRDNVFPILRGHDLIMKNICDLSAQSYQNDVLVDFKWDTDQEVAPQIGFCYSDVTINFHSHLGSVFFTAMLKKLRSDLRDEHDNVIINELNSMYEGQELVPQIMEVDFLDSYPLDLAESQFLFKIKGWYYKPQQGEDNFNNINFKNFPFNLFQ